MGTTQTTTKQESTGQDEPSMCPRVIVFSDPLGYSDDKNSRDTPGVSWIHHADVQFGSLDQSHSRAELGPAVTRWALRFLRLSIFSSNQGPVWALKTRALCKDQSQRVQHLVTDNVPDLFISSHDVPTLVMFDFMFLGHFFHLNFYHVSRQNPHP